MVLNVFFGPFAISYDVWMMSHTKFKKLFLRLKIGPKTTIRPFFPLELGESFQKNFGPKLHQKILQVLGVSARKSTENQGFRSKKDQKTRSPHENLRGVDACF